MIRRSLSRAVALLTVFMFAAAGIGFSGPTSVTADSVTVTDAAYGKVVHITLDGFYSGLYDLAKQQGVSVPNLDKLVSSGIRITDMKTTIPANQAARYSAMTGAYPSTTGNTFVYYDPATQTIVGDGQSQVSTETYTNDAETLTHVLEQHGRSALAINEKAVKDESVYVDTGATTLQSAVDAAIARIQSSGQPDYLNLYSDELRINAIYKDDQPGLAAAMLEKLQAIDVQLGRLIDEV